MKRTFLYTSVLSAIAFQGFALAGGNGKIGAYDFSYQIDNGRGVTQAFDDGQKTYLQLRAGVATPVVYQVSGGTKRQIDVTTNGVIAVIPATGKNFIVEINGEPIKVTYVGTAPKAEPVPDVAQQNSGQDRFVPAARPSAGSSIAVMTGRFSVSGAPTNTADTSGPTVSKTSPRPVQPVKVEEPAPPVVDKSWVYQTGRGEIIKTGSTATPKRGDGIDPTLVSTTKEYPLPFALGKPVLGPKGKAVINKVLAEASNPTSLTISVPMDGKGSELKLANERTQNVKAALLKGGVNAPVVTKPVPGKVDSGVAFGAIVLSYTSQSKTASLPADIQKAGEVKMPVEFEWLMKEVGPDAAQAAQEVIRLSAAGTISTEDAVDMLEKIVTLPLQRSRAADSTRAIQQPSRVIAASSPVAPVSAPSTSSRSNGFSVSQPEQKRTGVFKVERPEPAPVMVAAVEPKVESPKVVVQQDKPQQQKLVFAKGEVDGSELSAYVRKNGLQAAYVIRASNFSTVFSTREQLAAMGVKKIITNVDAESGKDLSINAVANKYGI